MGVMPLTRRYFRGGGTQFTSAFATTPLCCPSRATILTGRYAHNTGFARTSRRVRRLDDLPAPPGQRGLPNGHGRKFLNGWKRRRVPYFDHWALLKIALSKYTRPWLNVDGETRRFSGYSTDLLAATRSTSSSASTRKATMLRGFFYVAPSAPHYPWTPAPRHARAPVPLGRATPPYSRKTAPTSPRTSGSSTTRSPRRSASVPASSGRSCPSTRWWPHLSQARRAGREAGDAGDLHLGQRLPLGRPRDRRRGLDGRAEARALQRVRPGAVLPALARPSRRGRHRSAAGRERRHRADRALGGRHRPRSRQAASRWALAPGLRPARSDAARVLEGARAPDPRGLPLRTRRFQYVEYYRDGRRSSASTTTCSATPGSFAICSPTESRATTRGSETSRRS